MTAHELIQYLTWVVYIVIFILVAIRAVRRPLKANIDIALFFLASTISIAFTFGTRLGLLPPGGIASAISTSLALTLAYLLVRLVDDFASVPTWVRLLSEASLVLLIIATFIYSPLAPEDRPWWLLLLQVLHLNGFLIYSAVAFFRGSRRSVGVTRRRLAAIAAGSIFLVSAIFVAVLRRLFPQQDEILLSLGDITTLASGVFYFLGFATPGLLRRAWQEPELRAFLSRAASLPRLPDTISIVHEMQSGAAKIIGAPNARVGLWDGDKKVLRFSLDGVVNELAPNMGLTTGRAFLTQKATFTPDIARDNPLYADAAKANNATAILAAPITAGDKRLGVLIAYAPRAPIFADEDLALLQLLADQAAVILESRTLIDEATRVRAHEEVTRLKDDFLSAAAHDLKTPLTTLVAQTQLLERRALRTPDEPIDLASIKKLSKEVQRLRTLVMELLDAASTEQGKLVGRKEETDLVNLAEEICARHNSERHPCTVEAQEPVVGEYDPIRVFQLIENLVENAVKYSPEGGAVRIKLWHDTGWNHLTVSDKGIGMSVEDMRHIFERFHRGRNVDDKRFAGMGLGLFICRGIAEQHGGAISATSTPGEGSTFHVKLPGLQQL